MVVRGKARCAGAPAGPRVATVTAVPDLAFVLVPRPVLPAADQVVASARAGGVDMRSTPGPEGMLTFDLAGGASPIVALMPAPYPDAPGRPVGPMSPPAEQAASAPAHLIVTALGLTGTARERDRTLAIVTAAVAQAAEAVGVMLRHGVMLHRGDIFAGPGVGRRHVRSGTSGRRHRRRDHRARVADPDVFPDPHDAALRPGGAVRHLPHPRYGCAAVRLSERSGTPNLSLRGRPLATGQTGLHPPIDTCRSEGTRCTTGIEEHENARRVIPDLVSLMIASRPRYSPTQTTGAVDRL
jgi:hypothetical protein